MDISEENNIHQRAKIPVGERLAILALANTYGVKGFPRGYPTFQAMELERNRIRVRFENTGNGLYIEGDNVNKLMIPGGDHVFHPAKGEVTPRGELLVSAEEVSCDCKSLDLE